MEVEWLLNFFFYHNFIKITDLSQFTFLLVLIPILLDKKVKFKVKVYVEIIEILVKRKYNVRVLSFISASYELQ